MTAHFTIAAHGVPLNSWLPAGCIKNVALSVALQLGGEKSPGDGFRWLEARSQVAAVA